MERRCPPKSCEPVSRRARCGNFCSGRSLKSIRRLALDLHGRCDLAALHGFPKARYIMELIVHHGFLFSSIAGAFKNSSNHRHLSSLCSHHQNTSAKGSPACQSQPVVNHSHTPFSQCTHHPPSSLHSQLRRRSSPVQPHSSSVTLSQSSSTSRM